MSTDRSSQLQAMVVVDIVGSTATRMRIGDSSMERLRRRTDMIIAHAVRRHGGSITAWLGDGCQAVFASATAGIHAAQDMVAWVERDNGRVGRASDLHVRAAVDVGPARDLARLTDELSRRARPGTVVISDRAAAAAGSWSDRRHPTEGFSPVVAKTFAELTPLPSSYADAAPHLLGRESELDSVLERAPRVIEGRGCVTLLRGPAGIGKTTLVGAVTAELASLGFMVLATGCSEVAGRPFSSISDLLERWIDHVPEYDLLLGEGAEALALISKRLAVPASMQSIVLGDPDADRARLVRAIAAWVEELGAATPTALVVEDAQWAGAATTDAIQAMARAARTTRVMLIVTSRTTGASELTTTPTDVALDLTPLTDEAAEALVAQTNPDLTETAVRALAARARGNPLFAVELARHGAADDGSAIPASLSQTIADRVRALSEPAVDVLSACSILGDSAEVRILREMVDIGDELYDALDEAVHAAMLTGPDDSLTYRFAHQVVRSVLYERVGPAKRARLHERAGVALETIGRGVSPAELADHFAFASPLGHADTAARYCEAAALQAVETFAMTEAVDWYERGIGLVELDEHLRARLQVGWASAARQVGIAGWSEPIAEACAVADRLGDGKLLAEAALAGYRGTFTRALRVDEEKVARLRRALDLIPDDDVGLLSRVNAELGLELEWAADAGLARSHSDRALELAERSGDDLIIATVLAHRLWTLYHPAALREEATERLLELTAAERRPMLALEAHGAASFTAIRRGDSVAAEEHLSHVIRLANEIGVPLVHWFVLLRMWPWVLARGRYVEAEQMAEEMYRLGRLTDHPDAEQAYQTHLFWLGFDRRSREETRQVMKAMVPFAHKVKPIAWPSWVHVCVDAAMSDEARELCQLIAELPLDIERADQMFLMRLYDLAVAAEALGDTALAHRLLPMIEPRVGAHANMTFASYGSMARAMGLACAAIGEVDDARSWLHQAVNSNRRAGVHAWEARSLVDLARFEPAGRGDHLARARMIGEAWHLPGVLEDVHRLESG